MVIGTVGCIEETIGNKRVHLPRHCITTLHYKQDQHKQIKFQVPEEHLNIVEALQQLCGAETTGNSHGGRDRDRRKIHSHHCLRPHLWHKKYTAQGRWANPSRFGGNLEVCFDQIWGLLWNSKSAL